MKTKNISPIHLHEVMDKIGREIHNVLNEMSEKDTKKFLKLIIKSKRIFVFGSGRSGLVAEAFAMRLVHLGKSAFVIGSSICPPLNKKDLIVVISGSGKTKLVNIVAKNFKSKICLITANKNSVLAKKAKLILYLNAKTKISAGKKSVEPLGSLFEQSAFIYLDSIILLLMKKLKKTEEFMRKKHSKIK